MNFSVTGFQSPPAKKVTNLLFFRNVERKSPRGNKWHLLKKKSQPRLVRCRGQVPGWQGRPLSTRQIVLCSGALFLGWAHLHLPNATRLHNPVPAPISYYLGWVAYIFSLESILLILADLGKCYLAQWQKPKYPEKKRLTVEISMCDLSLCHLHSLLPLATSPLLSLAGGIASSMCLNWSLVYWQGQSNSLPSNSYVALQIFFYVYYKKSFTSIHN